MRRRLSCCRRTPCFLGHSPVDARKKIGQLRRRDRHDAVCNRRPQESATLKSFCEQTSPLAVVPNNLKKIATAAPKNVEIARQAGVDRSLLYRWRQQLLAGAKHSPVILSHDVPAFVPLAVAPPAPEPAPATIMIEFGANVCMKIEGAPDAQTLSNVIGALTANERRPGRAKLA